MDVWYLFIFAYIIILYSLDFSSLLATVCIFNLAMDQRRLKYYVAWGILPCLIIKWIGSSSDWTYEENTNYINTKLITKESKSTLIKTDYIYSRVTGFSYLFHHSPKWFITMSVIYKPWHAQKTYAQVPWAMILSYNHM